MTTLYCAVSAQVSCRGLAGLILRPFFFFPVRRELCDFSCSLAARLVKRHWQAVLKRWSMVSCDEPPRPEDVQQPLLSSAGRQSSRDSFAGHRAQGTADAGATPAGATGAAADSALNLEPVETPCGTPADAEVFVQPSLAKGMPFHNGFLYKLGDGLLNTGWNLRYFLLIGQTLQYYRSQHEAKPRDAISLSGVSVEWSHDASRPFTFIVSKSGQRSFCLSGCTEREACEWVERIQAASAAAERPLTTPAGTRLLGVLPQPGELPEPVETGATTWQEAAMARCTQELSGLLHGADFQLRELRHGVRILQRRSAGHRGAKFAALDLSRLGSLFSTAVLVIVFFCHKVLREFVGQLSHAATPRAGAVLLVGARCRAPRPGCCSACFRHWRGGPRGPCGQLAAAGVAAWSCLCQDAVASAKSR